MFRPALVIAASLLLLPPSVEAQTPSTQAAGWYVAKYHRFKPGRADEGRQIAREHFGPVDQAIGRAVIAFESSTAEWHLVAYIPLPGGPRALDRKVDEAERQRWIAALARQEGGEDKARALLARWNDALDQLIDQVVYRSK